MSHCDTVTNRNRRKYTWYAACHGNAHLDSLCDLIQIHMARYDLVIRIDNTDQRTLHLFLGQPKRIEQ